MTLIPTLRMRPIMSRTAAVGSPMMDLFAVFPVGSDVESVEKTGYFDASALAAAQKQKPVDTDRPFLMYRDVNQYKDGEKESTYTKGLVRSIHALQRLQQLQG